MTVPAIPQDKLELLEMSKPLSDSMYKVGRPLAITEPVVQKLLHAYSLGCTDTEAVVFAGIGRSTLFDYIKINKQFSDRREELKKTPVLLSRSTLIKDLKDSKSPTRTATAKFLVEKEDGKAIQSVNMQVASYNVVRKQYDDPKD